MRFLRWRECTTTRFFLGVDDRDPITRTPLEPPILIATTPPGEGIACPIRQACIMRLARIGVAPEATVTARIDPEEVVDRGALFLATGVFLLFLWIRRTVEGSLRPLMPTRGDMGTPFRRSAASHTAKSSAVRAGSSSGWAKA